MASPERPHEPAIKFRKLARERTRCTTLTGTRHLDEPKHYEQRNIHGNITPRNRFRITYYTQVIEFVTPYTPIFTHLSQTTILHRWPTTHLRK